MSLTVAIFPYGPLQENTYVVTDAETGFRAVIDPGYFGNDIKEEIGDNSNLKFILLTHGHYDHFAAVRQYIQEYPEAMFIIPAGEHYLLYEGTVNQAMAGGPAGKCPDADKTVSEGDVIELGKTSFRVIETPGHTEGGVCYVTDTEMFSGDTLFRLSVGNTSFETGDWATLVRSIQNKLFTLPEELIVYSGHGQPTSIGFEKRANPFV